MFVIIECTYSLFKLFIKLDKKNVCKYTYTSTNGEQKLYLCDFGILQ